MPSVNCWTVFLPLDPAVCCFEICLEHAAVDKVGELICRESYLLKLFPALQFTRDSGLKVALL